MNTVSAAMPATQSGPDSQSPQANPQALALSLVCSSCNKPINNQYVRALGGIYHANCFRCLDCKEIVTAKFFSLKLPDGKQVPLCEVREPEAGPWAWPRVDYFRRLDLLCAKCGQALRGSYITATDKKYHVQHFTCSCCSTLFGPQDSYYEHQNAQGTDVYCHYHYSTRCAQKCASCQTAILRQFVEVNRSSRDEAYHLPCHLIQKYWNVKISTPRQAQIGNGINLPPPWQEEESLYNPLTLKDQQKQMDELVHRIWTVLSAYEESSAACISDLLKSVSSVGYLEAIRSAERFIFHVEVLFAALDDLEFHFELSGATKGIAHVRESRVLCRKTVDLFTQLSHTQRDVSRQGITQDLLGLITGIAHYLKILLRIALLGALRLRREYNDAQAVNIFLSQLHRLMEEGGDPLASRRITSNPRSSNDGRPSSASASATSPTFEIRVAGKTIKEARSRQGVAFGFKSLDPEISGNSPYAQEYLDVQNGTRLAADFLPPSDLCIKCNGTIENGCVRLGTYTRWHVHCLCCDVCGKSAGPVPASKIETKSVKSAAETEKDEESHEESEATKREKRQKLQERLQAEAVAESYTFILDPQKTVPPGLFVSPEIPEKVFCNQHRTGESHFGFQSVSRLEQYSYLLNVALLRLYSILKRRGAIQSPTGTLRRKLSSPRESMDMARLRTISLDRKNTTVKTPKRLTIVESPVGKAAQTTSVALPSDDHKPSSKKPSTPSPKNQHKPLTPPSPSKKGVQDSTPKVDETVTPQRPEFTRMNSQVVVMEEFPSQTAAAVLEVPTTLDMPITEEPEEDHESLRLADIQSLVEAEQAKDRRSSLLSSGSSGDTAYLSDLEPLDAVIVKHAALWLLNHSELKDKFDADDILEGIEVRKGGLWNKFFRGEKKVKKKGIFGVPLELLTERDGVPSSLGISRTTVKIPAFLDDLLSAMRQMDVSVEGIFRKNGNIRKMKEAIEALDRDGGNVDFSQENPVQLAALLKKFLLDMPDPLLTHRLHALFLATQTVSDVAERTRLLHLACTLLPKSHRNTLEALFSFLRWVALFANMDSAGSKMDIPNLAIVVAPSILSSKNNDPQREQSFAAIAVVTQMLKEQDLFNRVPEQCLQLLADKKDLVKCATESSKDLLKKCHQHYAGKSHQSAKSPLTSPVTVQFAPSTLHNHKSDGSLDGRGRIQFEKKAARDSKSLERREPRERSNTLRKPKPGLPHSPFSMPVGIATGGSSQKLPLEPSPLSLGTLSAGALIEPPPSAPPMEPNSLPESNGHLA